jgi:hypothetical protein
MILVGVRGSCSCPSNDLFEWNAAVLLCLAIDMRVCAGGEAGIRVPEVFGDLVDRVPGVDEERRGRVAKVVGAKVRRHTRPLAGWASFALYAPGGLAGGAWIGDAEGGQPDPLAPVLAAKVASAPVRKHECVGFGLAHGNVEGSQFFGHGSKELGLTNTGGLGWCESVVRQSAFNEQALARIL